MNMKVYMQSSHMLFTTCMSGRIVPGIQYLAFGSSLYIRYITAAHACCKYRPGGGRGLWSPEGEIYETRD